MTQNAENIQSIFNRIAPVYDALNDRLSLGVHRVWKQMTVDWSGAKPGQICLDLCCGSGDLTYLLAKKVGNKGQVYGVDFSANLLAMATRRPPSLIKPTAAISWVEADVLALPFANDYFDAATMGYGLRNVTNIPQCLQELYRVLKPGGRAAILDFHRPASPLMRQFQQWYLDHWVVPAAEQFGLTEEYAYIGPSLDRFPAGPEQVKLSQAAGFTEAIHYPLAGGMMGVLVVKKGSNSF